MTQAQQQSEIIVVGLIRDKAQSLRQEADYLDKLEAELRQVAQPQTQAKRPVGNLREVVTQILLSAPDQRLHRRDIIQRVREQLPQTKPIGVISTLAKRGVFKKVDGDYFTLRNGSGQTTKP